MEQETGKATGQMALPLMITRRRIEANAERYDPKQSARVANHERLKKLLHDIEAELAAPHHAKDQTLAALRKGIIHRREVDKANTDPDWNPAVIQAAHAVRLLDWIEDRLDGILPPPQSNAIPLQKTRGKKGRKAIPEKMVTGVKRLQRKSRGVAR